LRLERETKFEKERKLYKIEKMTSACVVVLKYWRTESEKELKVDLKVAKT